METINFCQANAASLTVNLTSERFPALLVGEGSRWDTGAAPATVYRNESGNRPLLRKAEWEGVASREPTLRMKPGVRKPAV